jgi:lipopolysaccharide export system permease protein
MSLIDRYVAGTVMRHFAYALAGLLAVFAVMTLTGELRSAGTPAWGVGQALWFVVLTLPSEAYDLFPAAALLGAVLAFGRMASDNELVALQAAGVSRLRLVAAALMAAGVLAVVGVGLGETIAAPLTQRANAQRALAFSGGRALNTASGLWMRDGARFVNVGAVRPDGSLDDLYLYDFDDRRRLACFMHARSASPVDGAWQLRDVHESTFADDVSRNRDVAAVPWATAIDLRQIRSLWLEPRDLSVAQLRRTIGVLRTQGQNSLGHEVALWRRMSAPLYTGVMVLLGLPMVMASGRTARLGERATLGALVGLGFQMFGEMFTNLALVAGWPPLLTALAPLALAAAAVCAIFRWERVR